ncbi:MAG TPA: TAT-variant-translocated molybdopterin oxidoreductase [Vicinamibacterales bacterium]|nr:TAT-variant-translocated molybdopterin oxidoreductase [Vicinamibacterales bacterium]
MDFAPTRKHWRSLDELADTREFQELLHREFPENASTFTDPVGRRQFLKLMSASLALAGVGACTKQPVETIVPYVRQPEELVPGKPLFYATAMPFGGYAVPVLAENHEGRPTKIEGNPDHPASLGATSLWAQASVLSLYDPDRMKTVTYRGEVETWGAFITALRRTLTLQRAQAGSGVRILTETVTSPSMADLLDGILKALPQAKWHQWEPAARTGARAGLRQAFGRDLDAIYHFDKADVIVVLDADFLGCEPASVRYAHDFSSRRRVESGPLNRLYSIESGLTPTGSKADHRLALKPSEVETFARALGSALGVGGGSVDLAGLPRDAGKWVQAIAKDLRAHQGRALVVPGDEQTPAVHVLAHAMNAAVGAGGTTVTYTEPVEPRPVNHLDSLRELVADLEGGAAQLVLILGGNPVFTAPADLKFAEKLARAPLAVYLGPDTNETAQLCHWNIPEAHYLESWGDVRAFDGTVSIVQPLIAPLYGGKTASEVLATLTDRPDRNAHAIVRDYWTAAHGGQSTTAWTIQTADGGSFDTAERFWRTALHDGFIRGTQAAPVVAPVTGAPGGAKPAPRQGIEIRFRPDPTVWDGRFANNGWLQEMPKPITKLTWDTAAYISPATAGRIGVSDGDLIEIRHSGRSIRMPVLTQPGHAADAVTVHFGYGRRVAGRVGSNVGFDAYPLRGSDALWIATAAELVTTGERYPLASTQKHFLMEDRDLVRVATEEEYRHEPEIVRHMRHTPPKTLTLYPEYEYKGHKWGMAIDLSACTGCNACVVACQAENNIPIVGKEQVQVSREMHWLRVDTYYDGPADAPTGVYHQPLPCMQCEAAPCEVVCPVAATTHSAEGLNDMVYNRCVGTRYCSNNCPYKVRRFNFTLYSDWTTPSLQGARNPDVTVRSRGVMEKCTYCVQRINQARIEAKKEDRGIQDGDVMTACQATCPSQAIVFGDINDPKSRVTALKLQQRNYGLLEELNTRPRTTYLAAIRNPNPELEPSGEPPAQETHG